MKSFVDQSCHPFQDESAQPFTREAVEGTGNEAKPLYIGFLKGCGLGFFYYFVFLKKPLEFISV